MTWAGTGPGLCRLCRAHDRDTDVVWLWSEHYRGQAEPSVHAAAIRARGEWMQGAVDPAARGRGQKDGEQLLQNYIVTLGRVVYRPSNSPRDIRLEQDQEDRRGREPPKIVS